MSEYYCPVCGAQLSTVTGGYRCPGCSTFIDKYEVEEDGLV